MPHIHINTLNFQFYLYKKLIEKHWENYKKEEKTRGLGYVKRDTYK